MTPMMMRFVVLAAAIAAASMHVKVRADTPPAASARSGEACQAMLELPLWQHVDHALARTEHA